MQTTPDTASASRSEAKACIKRIRSRLERWELTHLRELAASLHEQLQEAERRADEAEQRANDAERRADWFMDMNHDMEAELRNCDKQLGLTQDGAMVLMPCPSTRQVCDDFGNLVEVAR